VCSKCIILIVGCLILIVLKQKLLETPLIVADFIILFNLLLFFLLILISSFDFITLIIAIEGTSLVLYALGGFFVTNLLALEAIVKYFILSSLVGSFSIFGTALIFAIVGSLDFLELQVQASLGLQS